jgi:hypothetical protein
LLKTSIVERFLPWTLIGCTVVVAGDGANWPTIRFAKLEPGAPSPKQLWWFDASDIVSPSAMLAGGADRIHKLMDAFRKFMGSFRFERPWKD